MSVIGYTCGFSSAYYLKAVCRPPLRVLKFRDVTTCQLVNSHRCLQSVSCLRLKDKQVSQTTLKMEAVSTSETQVTIYQSAGQPTPEQLNLHLLNPVIHTDVCDVVIGSQLFLLSHRNAEYKTQLKKSKMWEREKPRSTPSCTPFTELGVVLWKQLESRKYVSLRHRQNKDKSRLRFQNILCFSAVPCFHTHSSFSCICHVSDPLCLLLPSLSVRRKCSFMQFVPSELNRRFKTVFCTSVCRTECFSRNLLNVCYE